MPVYLLAPIHEIELQPRSTRERNAKVLHAIYYRYPSVTRCAKFLGNAFLTSRSGFKNGLLTHSFGAFSPKSFPIMRLGEHAGGRARCGGIEAPSTAPLRRKGPQMKGKRRKSHRGVSRSGKFVPPAFSQHCSVSTAVILSLIPIDDG